MTSDMPEVIWAKLDEDLKGTKFGPWSDPVDGYYGIDSGTRYRRGDIVDDLTKQLADANKLIDAKIVEPKCIHCGQLERNRSALCPSRAGFGGDWHEWAALPPQPDRQEKSDG